MKWLLLCMFLCYFVAGFSQSNSSYCDSLQHELLHATVPQKLKIFNKLSNFFQFKDPVKARSFEHEGLATAQKAGIDSDVCTFYGYIAENEITQGRFTEGIKAINNEFDIAEKDGNKKLMASALSDIGLAYEMQGDYSVAQDYFFKSLHVAEQINHTLMQAICNTNISVIYLNQKNFDKTIEYANRARAFDKVKNYPAIQGKVYEMLGSAYTNKLQFDSAQKYYNYALNVYKNAGDKVGIAAMYTLLAGTYASDLNKQLSVSLQAQQMWDSIAPENLYAISNMGNIGITYGNMAHKNTTAEYGASFLLYNKAEEYLQRAIALSKKTDSKQNISDLSDSLAVVQFAMGKYKEAYNNLQLHNTINDSIFSQENKNKIASIEGKHEIELRDKQLQINRLEIQNGQKERWFLLAGLLMVAIIAMLAYNQSRQRKKLNVALQQLNTQLNEANNIKTNFFNIINHDLRRPIAGIITALKLQHEEEISEEMRQASIRKTTASAENLLETMDDLLLWGKGQMENFKPVLKTVTVTNVFNYIQQSLPANNKVKVNFQQTGSMQLVTDEHYIKTIMHNLTGNALNALGNSEGGVVNWDAWQTGDVTYFSITDNGPGITEKQLRPLYDATAPMGLKNGLGLHIVRDIAHAVGCEVEFDKTYTEGARILLRFN